MKERLRILLIQPENKEINRFRKRQFNNFVQITMPYLAGFIDENQYEITLVDEYNEKIPYGSGFDLVALTVNTPNASHCYEIGKRFMREGAKVVMGGPHASLVPDEVEQHCDFIMIGESEDTWPCFLNDFYWGRAEKRYMPSSPPTLENLPFPRWDLLKNRNKIMKGAVIASRGCPYHCSYCNLRQIYFKSFRTRPVSQVIEEIKRIKSKFFVFWDDNLFADRAYVMELLKALAPLRKKWAAQVTLRDCDNDELLELAAKAGCLYLFVGLESFGETSLKDAGKEINSLEDYERLIKKIHKHKILIQAGVIFGFDHDAPGVFEKTLSTCEELGIDGVTVSILTPFPKTPVYENFKEEGRLKGEGWTHYDGKTGVAFEPAAMTEEQLYNGYLWFRRKFYSVPSFIKRYKVSKTHLLYNLFINLGYRLALSTGKMGK